MPAEIARLSGKEAGPTTKANFESICNGIQTGHNRLCKLNRALYSASELGAVIISISFVPNSMNLYHPSTLFSQSK